MLFSNIRTPFVHGHWAVVIESLKLWPQHKKDNYFVKRSSKYMNVFNDCVSLCSKIWLDEEGYNSTYVPFNISAIYPLA